MKKSYIQTLVRQALREDQATRDVTTLALIPQRGFATARIVFKQAGIVCGQTVAREAFRQLDSGLRYKILVNDKQHTTAGRVVAVLRGKTRALLSAERTALNFLGRMSGIATLTQRYVSAASPTKPAIMDTRKTTPTLRLLERYAVHCGGGKNHRFDLSEMVMIKDNHRAACLPQLSIPDAIRLVRSKTRKKIIVEVDTLEQLAEALLAKPDIILLDNMTPRKITQAVSMRDRLNKKIKLEASGGITLRSVKNYAQTGIDRISLGALTHSAIALDVSLELENDNT